jgi:hypothetical protein
MEQMWNEQIAELEKEDRFPAIVLSSGKYLSDCEFILEKELDELI